MPSQADEYCTTADMCAAAAQAEGLRLGNDSYPFALPTNTYGCWYYPRSHANKNYAGSAFWGVQSSDEQMKDPDPGAAHHVRLKCGVANAAPITGFCTTKDACASAAQAAGKMLGNKRGNSGYPFVLETNTYGCWYYPDSHANKNYAGSAFWGAASSKAQMTDPDPGDAHHVRLKCEGGGPAQPIMEAAPEMAAPKAKPVPQQRRGTQQIGGRKVYKNERRMAPVYTAKKEGPAEVHSRCKAEARKKCFDRHHLIWFRAEGHKKDFKKKVYGSGRNEYGECHALVGNAVDKPNPKVHPIQYAGVRLGVKVYNSCKAGKP